VKKKRYAHFCQKGVSKMKKPIKERVAVVRTFIQGKIDKQKAAEVLGCTTRTIENYRQAFLTQGGEGLIDHRHNNFIKVSAERNNQIINLKKKDPWRSARNIRDKLNLPLHETTVWRVLKRAGLVRENVRRVKAIRRFEAEHPNDLWQTDIMGKITLPNLGDCYLIATLDDHSRFCLSGRWFKRQGKMNVFQIWY